MAGNHEHRIIHAAHSTSLARYTNLNDLQKHKLIKALFALAQL
jgi:hypothetical protein